MSMLKSCRSNLRDGRASGVTLSEQDAEVHAERNAWVFLDSRVRACGARE